MPATRGWRRWALVSRVCVVATWVALGTAFAAPPSTAQACVEASEVGQQAQQANSLKAARAAFTRCADSACPPVVASQCTRWLDEVIAATPSVVMVVRVGGLDQAHAEVRLDGQPWLENLTGLPEEVEPGPHRLTVRVQDQVQEQTLIVNVGEKHRVLVFRFDPAPVLSPVPPVSELTATARPGLSAAPWVVSGGALLAWGSFAVLGLVGRGRLDSLLKAPCASTKTCAPAQVTEIRGFFVGADLSAAVAVAATVASVILWWKGAEAPAVSLSPTVGGVSFSFQRTW